MRRDTRKIPEINTISTADMAFILLVFFVLLTSIDTNVGLQVELPKAKNRYSEIIQNQQFKERNILRIEITNQDELLCGNQRIALNDLKNKVKDFLVNANNENTKPEFVEMEIPFFGNKRITKNHVISIKSGGDTSYKVFFEVQNEVIKAYDELRDEIAWTKWQTKFITLTLAQQKAVEQIFPYKIAEVITN